MRHRIQRQQFLLTLPPAVDAFRAQQAAGRFFHEVLLPLLEDIFDELSPDDHVLYLDSFSIDIGILNLASLYAVAGDATLYQRLRTELKRMIEQELAAKPQLRRSARIKAWDTWRYYMENGYLPWNGDPPDDEALHHVLAQLAVDYEAVSWLRQAIQPGTRVLTRVVAQHDDEFLTQLVTVLTASRHPELTAVIREVIHLFRLLDQRYRDWTTPADTPAENAAAAAHSLTRWAQRMTPFRQAPETQQRAILWQQLLAAAAARPADFISQGAPSILLHDLEEEPALLDMLLEAALNRAELQTRSWLQAARTRRQSRERITEIKPDHDSGKPRTATPVRDQEPAPAKPPEQGASDTGQTKESAEQPSNAPRPTGEPDTAQPPSALPQYPAKARTTSLPAGNATATGTAHEADGIYVTLAGLVLLHPFLTTLFHRTGHWDGAAFKDQEARQQAVLLAYYLATGDQQAPEYALAFPKILCGFPLEHPLPAAWELPPPALAEADVLLDNVLLRWEKLGNTSVAGLRQSFLQRGGKLTNKDGRRTLQLETAGIDVLLDYLPWNLSLVKLPWWKQMLHVEWR